MNLLRLFDTLEVELYFHNEMNIDCRFIVEDWKILSKSHNICNDFKKDSAEFILITRTAFQDNEYVKTKKNVQKFDWSLRLYV